MQRLSMILIQIHELKYEAKGTTWEDYNVMITTQGMKMDETVIEMWKRAGCVKMGHPHHQINVEVL